MKMETDPLWNQYLRVVTRTLPVLEFMLNNIVNEGRVLFTLDDIIYGCDIKEDSATKIINTAVRYGIISGRRMRGVVLYYFTPEQRDRAIKYVRM